MYNSILSFYLNKNYEPDIQYNGNVKYSFKNLKDGHTGNDFLELDVYLNEKKSSAKIQLLNIFKDNHILPYLGPATVMMNGRYLMSFGRIFTMAMINTCLN